MGFTIKPEEMQISDFKKFSLLRHIARHKCKCGETQVELAMDISKVFGPEKKKDKMVLIQPWEEVIRKARDRQITEAGIRQTPAKKVALKYNITETRVRQIWDKGFNRVFKIGDLPPPA